MTPMPKSRANGSDSCRPPIFVGDREHQLADRCYRPSFYRWKSNRLLSKATDRETRRDPVAIAPALGRSAPTTVQGDRGMYEPQKVDFRTSSSHSMAVRETPSADFIAAVPFDARTARACCPRPGASSPPSRRLLRRAIAARGIVTPRCRPAYDEASGRFAHLLSPRRRIR